MALYTLPRSFHFVTMIENLLIWGYSYRERGEGWINSIKYIWKNHRGNLLYSKITLKVILRVNVPPGAVDCLYQALQLVGHRSPSDSPRNMAVAVVFGCYPDPALTNPLPSPLSHPESFISGLQKIYFPVLKYAMNLKTL